MISVDYTKITAEMEAKFTELDEDSALRPTIIKPGDVWQKKFQKSLLLAAESSSLGTDEQGTERKKCFDLLDALTKSGALPIDYASLHVVIAATHCFDKTLMDTLVQGMWAHIATHAFHHCAILLRLKFTLSHFRS